MFRFFFSRFLLSGFFFFVFILFAHPFSAQAAASYRGHCSFTCLDALGGSHPIESQTLDCNADVDCLLVCTDYCKLNFDSCRPDVAEVCVPGSAPAPPLAPAPLIGMYGLLHPLQGAGVVYVIGGFVKYALGVVGALALFMMIYGGIMYMTASDPKQVQSSRQTLQFAFLGLLALLGAYTAVSYGLTLINAIFAS